VEQLSEQPTPIRSKGPGINSSGKISAQQQRNFGRKELTFTGEDKKLGKLGG